MSKRLMSEKEEKLVLENLRLVHHFVRKYNINFDDYDDFISIGTIGLIKAAKNYNPEKNIVFSTYASRCIINEINMALQKEKLRQRLYHLETVLYEDDQGDKLTLGDVIPDNKRNLMEDIEDKEEFENFINFVLTINDIRSRLVMLYEIAGIKQREIAKKINVSQCYVSMISRKNKETVKQSKTSTKTKTIFSHNVIENSYILRIHSIKYKQLTDILTKFFNDKNERENLPKYSISRKNNKIILEIPDCLESLYLIAEIIREAKYNV